MRRYLTDKIYCFPTHKKVNHFELNKKLVDKSRGKYIHKTTLFGIEQGTKNGNLGLCVQPRLPLSNVIDIKQSVRIGNLV